MRWGDWFQRKKPMTTFTVMKMDRWRYFTNEEVKGLVPDLVYKLDRFRAYLGMPVYLTETVASGPPHVPGSEHETGEAVDCTIRPKSNPTDYTDKEKLRIVWAAGKAGFDRVGIYDRHCHLGVSKLHPTPAIWTGKSS